MKINIIIFFTLNLYINLILSVENFNSINNNSIIPYDGNIKQQEEDIAIMRYENKNIENEIKKDEDNISIEFEQFIKSVRERENEDDTLNLSKLEEEIENFESKDNNNNQLFSIAVDFKFFKDKNESFLKNLKFFENNLEDFQKNFQKNLILFENLKEKYRNLQMKKLSLWSSFLEIKNTDLKDKKEFIEEENIKIKNYNLELEKLNENFLKKNYELNEKLQNIESDKKNNNEMFEMVCFKADIIFRSILEEDQFVIKSLDEYTKFLLNSIGKGNSIEEKILGLKEKEREKYRALKDLYNLKRFYEKNKDKDIGSFLKNNRIENLLKAHEVIKRYELGSLEEKLRKEEETIEENIADKNLIGLIMIAEYLNKKKDYEEKKQKFYGFTQTNEKYILEALSKVDIKYKNL